MTFTLGSVVVTVLTALSGNQRMELSLMYDDNGSASNGIECYTKGRVDVDVMLVSFTPQCAVLCSAVSPALCLSVP